ncbi:Probable folate-biopterin transporter 7 [Linum perenne]
MKKSQKKTKLRPHMVSSSSGLPPGHRRNPIRVLLGLGYWVQGFRCFPWLAVNFFLKDGLNLDPSTLQLLQNSANLPMVGKPLYGLISDTFYISGQHRLPYVAIGALLQGISWVSITLLSPSSVSILSLSLYLLLSNLGASLAEVANDAIVAEVASRQSDESSSSKSSSSSSSDLQSFVSVASSAGGVLGNLLGGIALIKFSPRAMFLVFGIIAFLQFLITILVRERSLKLPKGSPNAGLIKQLLQLSVALKKPEIAYSITWLAASFAIIPAFTGTMFYYQTQHLKIESSVLGMSKVFGQAALLVWSIVYDRRLKLIPARKLITAIQTTMAVLMLSDALFVKGIYRNLGVPDSLYVVIFSGPLEVLFFFKILPFNIVMAQQCPRGCEGSLMALVASAVALSLIISGYLGIALASFVEVTGDDFSGLPRGLMIQAIAAAVPIYWSSCIPDDTKMSAKKD